jgi:hypothetical protein
MLWENTFYEDGISIAQRISELIPKVSGDKVAAIAVEARENMKLRHIPLFIATEMTKYPTHTPYVKDTVARIIQRPDELTEILAIYQKTGRLNNENPNKLNKISKQLQRGIAEAFKKFNEYSLAKYNRDNAIKLRDSLFLCHAKPEDGVRGYNRKARKMGATVPNLPGSILFDKLVNDKLIIPDTWEVALSSGADKKSTWERLISEDRLGGLAILRNIRNMVQVGVSEELIKQAVLNMKIERILPFRFIAAAKYTPKYETQLEQSMLRCLSSLEKIPGKTVLLVDVSGSMDHARISEKSELTRIDVACGLAILAREICEDVDIFSFSMKLVQIPPRHGFALRDVIIQSQEHSGTPLGLAVNTIYANRSNHITTMNFRSGYRFSFPKNVDYRGQELNPDRLIVITDEQSQDPVPAPQGVGYMINVAPYKNGIGYKPWIHIDGWSEAVLDYVREYEKACLT